MTTDDMNTRPTIETVLESISALGREMRDRFDKVDERFARVDERFTRFDERFTRIDDHFTGIYKRFEGIEEQLREIDIRLDRLDAAISKTRYEFVDLRADLREWQHQLKGFLPPLR